MSEQIWAWDRITKKPVKLVATPSGELIISTAEAAIDEGVATGGTNTTLIDATKGWQVNIWEDAIVEVEIGGIQYTREIDSNTATTLNFATNPLLPPGVVVAAGCVYSIKRLVNPLSPIAKALVHNVAGYLAGADILGAAVVPTNTPCLFRIMAGFSASGILSVTITNVAGGGGTVVQQFQGGVALNINSLYAFSHLVHTGDTINYRYSVNTTIMTLRVVEIPSAI